MDTLTFHQALILAEAQARAGLPYELHERLSCAISLVKNGQVFQEEGGHTWTVASTSKPGNEYRINGQGCQCEDAHYRARKRCKHALAVYLSQHVVTLMSKPPAPVVPELVGPGLDNDAELVPQAPPVETAPTPAHGVDPRHIVEIQGRPFIKYVGLLELAHQRGLQSLTVHWTHNSDDLSLAHALAVFPFGTFEECADSTPANVGKKVALHWRRLSLTRAKARVLRDALNVDMVALEELGDA